MQSGTSESELTVWCVCTFDKYHSGYVYALKEMVEKNLTVPHQFKCITTRPLDGITTVRPYVPWASWWSKMALWHLATGPSLYFDLDVVITGNIDYLVPYTQYQFAAPANWAQSGHGGIQSSVMAWSGNFKLPLDECRKVWPKVSEQFHGDQEYLYHLYKMSDNEFNEWVKIEGIGSYKYHVRRPLGNGSIPDWMKVCVFHGKPDPHEVNDQCILPYTSTLRKSINGNMLNGCLSDSSATG